MTMEHTAPLQGAFQLPPPFAPGSTGLRITETARQLGVTTRALRYYEDEHLVTPGRTSSGARVYCAASRERLQLIVTFRRLGVPVATIRNAFDTGSADLVQMLRRRIIALEAEQRLLRETLAAVSLNGAESAD
jgi:DNA-binding transcriptional MerR regulator